MNVLVVNNKEFSALPPVVSLTKILLRNGYRVTVISEDSTASHKLIVNDNFRFIEIPKVDVSISAKSIIRYFKNRRELKKIVKREMQKNDVLWTTTDKTVRELGNLVLNYKHVMQLMELIEDTPAFPKQRLFWLNIKKYAQKAYKVVVPEYNRAQIQKAWWDLKELPRVLPNKVAEIQINEECVPDYVRDIIDDIKKDKKRMIIYQGIFNDDRDFVSFAEALKDSEDYYLCIMGRDTKSRRDLCEKYPNVKYIPFVEPPYHYLVTREAYIGLLPYQATKVYHLSVLNAVYCAPNKIFDYAAFGIPMIGTDVPGLSIPFNMYKIGKICKNVTPKDIVKAINDIAIEHDEMSLNCKRFFDSYNLDEIVNEILDDEVH